MRKIWVFLPAYNEADALPKLLPKIHTAMVSHNIDYHLVVVNDGSLDDTAAALERFKADLPLDVVTHAMNRGLGETERDGFEFIAAHCDSEDYIVRVEGDDTHDPQYIFDMIDKLGTGYDVVNTSRFQPGGGQLGVDGYRAFISRAANLFMKFLFGIPGTRDYSCGFRAYRARVIQDAIRIYGNNFIQLRGLGFTSTLETIVKLHMMGCRFAEVPFILHYEQKHGSSKMVASVTTLGYLTMAILYYWPFGGWRSQYRGLRRTYRENPDQAVEKYRLAALRRRRLVSRISL